MMILASPSIQIGFLAAAIVAGGDATAIVSSPSVEPADGVVAAAPTDRETKTEAVEAFEAGKKAFAAADYFVALAEFKRAQELIPTPELHYNIGLCHERVDNWDRAIESFEQYLEETPDAFDRADVESRIEAAKRRKAKESRPPSRMLTAVEEPPRSSNSTPSTRAAPPERDEEPRGKPHRPLVATGASLLGLGAAGVVGGVIGVSLRGAANDEVLRRVNDGNPDGIPIEDARALGRENQRLKAARWAVIGGGSAIAATGAVLLGIGLKRRADARQRRTSLTPQLGPRSAGLTMTGRF